MTAPRVRLTGIDEGLDVIVRTRIRGAEDGERIAQAFRALFPDARDVAWPAKPTYPNEQDISIEVQQVPLDTVLTKLHEQRILDTALDAMGANLDADVTTFTVERVPPWREKSPSASLDMHRSGVSSPSKSVAEGLQIGCLPRPTTLVEHMSPDNLATNGPWTETGKPSRGSSADHGRGTSVSTTSRSGPSQENASTSSVGPNHVIASCAFDSSNAGRGMTVPTSMTLMRYRNHGRRPHQDPR